MRFFRFPSKAGTLALALQGGGAHGAFTWGVLDGLLEHSEHRIAAVSGSSAGALNAVLLAQGLLSGGRAGARASLAAFWESLARVLPWELLGLVADGSGRFGPAGRLLMHWLHALGPAQANPLALDPLRELLLQQVDFEALRRQRELRLHLGATHAGSGRLRVFEAHELSVEVVLASACLPALRRAVQIDGQPYWDGGYSANPPLFPLVHERAADDLLLVMLSPWSHGGPPEDAEAIRTRTVEIAFNAAFLAEMRLLAESTRLARRALWAGPLERGLRSLRWHLIDGQDTLAALPPDSKLLPHPQLLARLRDAGRARALAWLAAEGRSLGRRSTVDLMALFAGQVTAA